MTLYQCMHGCGCASDSDSMVEDESYLHKSWCPAYQPLTKLIIKQEALEENTQYHSITTVTGTYTMLRNYVSRWIVPSKNIHDWVDQLAVMFSTSVSVLVRHKKQTVIQLILYEE